MKHALFAVALGVMAMTTMGCATDVEDPVPPGPASEEQRDPPKQALNAQLRAPQAQLISGVVTNQGLADVPPETRPISPPIPQPQPFVPAAE